MKVAIENFGKINHPNKIAILGDMFELGEYSELEHKKIEDFVKKFDFKQVVFVGSHFDKAAFKNVEELQAWFKNQHFENTYFLVKGSRGVALEKILE